MSPPDPVLLGMRIMTAELLINSNNYQNKNNGVKLIYVDSAHFEIQTIEDNILSRKSVFHEAIN